MVPEQDPGGETRERRLARNETFFRESNEILEREAKRAGVKHADFICECSSRGCMERLALTRLEYEHVRARGDRFVLVPGHENRTLEVVVEEHPDYVLVEKNGAAGVIARDSDPR